ncbi:MAG: outer membrane beta-barrel protein [Alphaproteobacteria bacterium]|nr:outer membrane beta-barrel protein [Alphaproteobacteria bacterium]
MFKRMGAALAAALLFVGPAAATPQAPIWTGFYLGAHGGGGWGDLKDSNEGFEDVNGGLGGIHGGYQWQSGNVVFGAEGDISFGKLDDQIEFINRGNFGGRPFTETTRFGFEVDRLASLRARIGYAAGPLHIFATGGVAWAWTELSFFDSLTIGGRTFVSDDEKVSDTQVGYTVGAGLEYKFLQNVSGRVDVQHYGFRDAFDIDDVDLNLTIVRGGLTFHFN